MRQLLLLSLLSFIFSCEPQKQNDEATSTPTGNDSTRVIVKTDTIYLTRNESITPANSYSDLFVDSSILENYIQRHKLSTADAQGIRSFYNYRNFQFAWFSSEGLTEELKGFWNLQDRSPAADKTLRNKMDTLLLNSDTLTFSRFDTTILNTEIALTNAWLQFYNRNHDKIKFSAIGPEKIIPVKKIPVLTLADSIIGQPDDTSFSMHQYGLLKQKLKQLDSIAKSGGWHPLVFTVKQMKKGTSSPFVLQFKKRLQLTGDFNNTDTSKTFNDSLEIAIKNYQRRSGMRPTGIITDTIIRSLNIPVLVRMQQLILNLNRMQWMPAVRNTNYISVNIPEFMLSVFENNNKVFDMPVVVGKEGTSTTMFNGDLNQIVFSPYWNIPASIVQREILPALKLDKDYLKKHNMEVTGKNDSLPVIRQLPGKDNGLGKVKFLFPNRYDIYFHDTYAKDIFTKQKRTSSHGCIRLADAEKMANYLLRNNSDWTPAKVHTAMNATKEQFVKVSPPVPVMITYFTSWVDENGQLNYRDDIYSHDKNTGLMLFGNSIASSGK